LKTISTGTLLSAESRSADDRRQLERDSRLRAVRNQGARDWWGRCDFGDTWRNCPCQVL